MRRLAPLLCAAFLMLCGSVVAASPRVSHLPSAAQNLPPDREYVTVQNGHLSVNGERLRLWCVIGAFPNFADIQPGDSPQTREQKRARAYADADAIVQRFMDLGFNGIRLWSDPVEDYRKGDGSRADVLDYFVSVAKKRGMRIWVPSVSWADVRVEDAELAGDPATADDWKRAVEEAKQKGFDYLWIARVWDPRMEAAQRKLIAQRLTRMNHHTGLRWADDPVFAVWELTNEEWWISKMVSGLWQGLPAYFQQTLSERWHAYLRDKYGSEERLIAKWGFLLPGESLEKGTVRIAPLNQGVKLEGAGMDAQARRQLEAAQSVGKQQYTRNDFSYWRGADVLEFFLQMQLAHKKRLGDYLKSLGKSARLSPLVYDTGIGYEIQSQYLHQNADAVAHDAYINGTSANPLNQRFPWYSGLEEWPRIAQDLPWLEHNRVEGKPFLCYETQIMQPAKYRAEFPLRLLALAAIQDWDAVCWHYWGRVSDITASPRPFDKPMDVTTGGHPQGYHFTYDEVQNAMMRAAAYMFRSGLLSPAPAPTTFLYGRRSLYDPASMDYGGSYGRVGLNMLPTTYQHGVRIWIDPSREDDEVKGPMVNPLAQALHTLIRPTPQIAFDIQRGGLTMDAPGAAAFTGFMAKYGSEIRFRNGVILRDVQVKVPPAMPYAEGLAQERYIGFALVSQDGQPLKRSRRAMLALVSSSFNTGFKLGQDNNGRAVAGELPVQVARVRATVIAPMLTGMRYTLRDWHMQAIGTGVVGAEGALKIPADRPVWVIELQRP